jgi:hypothetical protein
MNCDEAKLRNPDYWDRALSDTEVGELEAHWAVCPACRAESARLEALWNGLLSVPAVEPDQRVRTRFYDSLAALSEGPTVRRAPRVLWWQAAAAVALLGVGMAGGYLLRPDNTRQEVAQLRTEVTDMRQMMALSLLQQQSASERLRGISYAMRSEQTDPKVVDALVAALYNDANVNVRLAAVDALRAYSAVPETRQAVREALPHEMTPLVQVALIDLLVDWKEGQAANDLRRISVDNAIDSTVKQRATWALENLQ